MLRKSSSNTWPWFQTPTRFSCINYTEREEKAPACSHMRIRHHEICVWFVGRAVISSALNRALGWALYRGLVGEVWVASWITSLGWATIMPSIESIDGISAWDGKPSISSSSSSSCSAPPSDSYNDAIVSDKLSQSITGYHTVSLWQSVWISLNLQLIISLTNFGRALSYL